MSTDDLRRAARKQPFEPFRVTLTTGATYDILHPDLIMVGERSAIIGMTDNPKLEVYQRTIQVDLFHIVAIEELPKADRPSNGAT